MKFAFDLAAQVKDSAYACPLQADAIFGCRLLQASGAIQTSGSHAPAVANRQSADVAECGGCTKEGLHGDVCDFSEWQLLFSRPGNGGSSVWTIRATAGRIKVPCRRAITPRNKPCLLYLKA
jgi:hypothetical protein